MASIHYLPTEAAMHTNEWPARRCSDTKQQPVSYWPPRDLGDPDRDAESFFSNVVPFGAAECSTEIGADMPGVRAPLPNSVGRWARVLLGFIVCVFAAIGAGALFGFMTR